MRSSDITEILKVIVHVSIKACFHRSLFDWFTSEFAIKVFCKFWVRLHETLLEWCIFFHNHSMPVVLHLQSLVSKGVSLCALWWMSNWFDETTCVPWLVQYHHHHILDACLDSCAGTAKDVSCCAERWTCLTCLIEHIFGIRGNIVGYCWFLFANCIQCLLFVWCAKRCL